MLTKILLILIGIAALYFGLAMEPENTPLIIVGGVIIVVGVFSLPSLFRRK